MAGPVADDARKLLWGAEMELVKLESREHMEEHMEKHIEEHMERGMRQEELDIWKG